MRTIDVDGMLPGMTSDLREWAPGELVGEHRLLRRLGLGARAEVWLAAPTLVEDGVRVVIKLARPGVDPSAILAEAEVLWRVRGRHTVRIREVLPVSDGHAGLVLEHLPHELGGLATAGMNAGSGMHAGVAITVLAPLAAELRRLHGLGVVHGGVRLASVGLRSTGEPVLLGFGAAAFAHGPALDSGIAGDAVAFHALVMTVTSLVASERVEWRAFRRWLVAEESIDGAWLAEFERRAFDAAEPEPVPLPREGPSDVLGEPGAAPIAARPGASVSPGTAPVVRGGLLRGLPVPDSIRRLGAVRRRVWVPLALVGAGLVAVAIALPSDASGAAAARGPDPSSAASDAVPGIVPADPRLAPIDDPSSDSPTESPSAPPGTPPTGAEVTEAAAMALLAERSRCYAELSRDCLDAVVEPASDAEAVDRAAIEALVDGTGALPPSFLPVDATEYQRLGDAAIVDALGADGAGLRMLLMLTPQGWRIRAYLATP